MRRKGKDNNRLKEMENMRIRGATYKSIAENFGISRQRVHQIISLSENYEKVKKSRSITLAKKKKEEEEKKKQEKEKERKERIIQKKIAMEIKVKELYKALNRQPTMAEIASSIGVNKTTCYKRYGGVYKIFESLGLPYQIYKGRRRTYTEEEIGNKLKELYEKLGRRPKKKEIQESSGPKHKTYCSRYGGLMKAAEYFKLP